MNYAAELVLALVAVVLIAVLARGVIRDIRREQAADARVRALDECIAGADRWLGGFGATIGETRRGSAGVADD